MDVAYKLGMVVGAIFCIVVVAAIGWTIGWLLRNPVILFSIVGCLAIIGFLVLIIELTMSEEA